MSQIHEPRCHLVHGTVRDISLQLFSDAYEDGYDMCLSLIILCQWNCKMFVSGWKVKEFTSEADFHSYLQAATLSVKIYRVLMDELAYEISKITFWSDSQTTLQYIKNET